MRMAVCVRPFDRLRVNGVESSLWGAFDRLRVNGMESTLWGAFDRLRADFTSCFGVLSVAYT